MNKPANVRSDLNSNPGVDKKLLKRIIEIQDLPEEVVVKFLKAAGSLSSTNFGKRTLDEHR
jgi:hypothetical protein